MKRNKVLVLIFIFFFYVYYINNNIFAAKSISSAFESSDAILVKSEVTAIAKVKDISPEKAAIKLLENSNVNGKYTLNKNEDGIEIICKKSDIYICIKAKKIYDENLIYTSFLLSQHGDKQNINDIRRTIINAYKFYDATPSFYSLIQGKYTQRMNIDNMEKKANNILRENGAIFTDGVRDDKLVSLYGFVPGLKDKVQVINSYENLNIALRYSNVDKCTYIWVGSPIIAIDY